MDEAEDTMQNSPPAELRTESIEGDALGILRGCAAAVALWRVEHGVARLIDADLMARTLLTSAVSATGFPVVPDAAAFAARAAVSGRAETVGVIDSELYGEAVRLALRIVPLGGGRVASVWIELAPDLGGATDLGTLRALAATLGHDFNNVLQALEGNIELALEGSDVEVRLRAASAALVRARDVTGQLDALSTRASAASEVDLTALVRELGPGLRHGLPNSVVLAYDLAEEGPRVRVSSRALRQVIKNLVRNAAEAVRAEEGEIVITVGRCSAASGGYIGEPPPEGRYGYVEVKDDGRGIDPLFHARIFDPFYSTHGFGRGLGLTAAMSVTRAHHGAVRLRSAVGEGAAIRLMFPLEPEAEEEAVTLPDESLRDIVGSVLVVDDDEAVRGILKVTLDRAGFVVTMADDGDTGVAAFERLVRAEALDCVVLDLTMSRMSGPEALRRMREIAAGVPIIVTSGHGGEEVMRQLGALTADAVMKKPTAMSAMVEQVRRQVARMRARGA